MAVLVILCYVSTVSKLGGMLLTDKYLQQDLNHMNKIKKLVLHLYLLRVCYYLDPEDIRKKLRNGVNTVVSKVDDSRHMEVF